jgi:hypothetical protein
LKQEEPVYLLRIEHLIPKWIRRNDKERKKKELKYLKEKKVKKSKVKIS